MAASSRAELTIACRTLDRVIRAGRYWIPHWYKASHWIAYWDTFGRPRPNRAMLGACWKRGGTTQQGVQNRATRIEHDASKNQNGTFGQDYSQK